MQFDFKTMIEIWIYEKNTSVEKLEGAKTTYFGIVELWRKIDKFEMWRWIIRMFHPYHTTIHRSQITQNLHSPFSTTNSWQLKEINLYWFGKWNRNSSLIHRRFWKALIVIGKTLTGHFPIIIRKVRDLKWQKSQVKTSRKYMHNWNSEERESIRQVNYCYLS